MGRSKEQWHAWFQHCMLLSDSGFVPSDPAAKMIAPPSDVVQHWGEKQGVGYVFRESDGEEYFLYVNELFTRVHQREMVDRTLPLHFARGLLEESRGGQVNWAKFAMLRCFAGHKRTPFKPFPEFAEVNTPLPWTHPKVMPARGTNGGPERSAEHIQVAVGLGNASNGDREQPPVAVNPKTECAQLQRAGDVEGRTVANEVPRGEIPVEVPVRRVYVRHGIGRGGAAPVEEGDCFCLGSASLRKGLHTLRPELISAVAGKKDNLTELLNRDEYNRTRKRSAATLAKERAQGLRQKLQEWTNLHDRAKRCHESASAKTIVAASELSSAVEKNADRNIQGTVNQVHHLSKVVERSCLNNLRRFAEKVELYSGKVRDCEEEVMTNADELRLFELDISTITANRREQLQWMEVVSDFLESGITEGN